MTRQSTTKTKSANRQQRPSSQNIAHSTSDSVTQSFGSFESPAEQVMFNLQRTMGNRAVTQLMQRQTPATPDTVQRLVISAPRLLSIAGEPKPDKMLKLPGFSDRTVKKMSTNYKAILSEIGSYYTALNRTYIAQTGGERVSQQTILVGHLNQLAILCDQYTVNHLKAFNKAKKKFESTVEKNMTPPMDLQEEVIRYKEIGRVRGEVDEDIQSITNIIGNPANYLGLTWMEALAGPGPNLDTNKITGDPLAPNDKQGLTHGAPEAGMGFEVGINKAMAPAVRNTFNAINILADSANPVVTAPNVVPNDNQLFTTGAASAGKRDPVLDRTTANPSVDTGIVTDKLYVNNAPTYDDVMQGQIGDCYLLAALMSIVNTEPDRLTGMMSLNGGVFTTDFYRRDPKLDVWMKQRVQVDATLGKEGNHLLGASFKIAGLPLRSHWYVKQGGAANGWGAPLYSVVRKDFYEAALWVPLLEKAYARFSQTFGLYGQQDFSKQTATPGTGYGGMVKEGGQAEYTYGMFYGPALMDTDVETTQYSEQGRPDDNLLRNRPLIEYLIQMKDPNLARERDDTPMRLHLTASSSMSAHVKRAATVVKALLSDGAAQLYAQNTIGNDGIFNGFMAALRTFDTELVRNEGVLDSTPRNQLQPLVDAARAVVKQDAQWQALLRTPDNDKPIVFMHLTEVAANLLNIGTDAAPGQGNIFSKHAYAILNVRFKNQAGQDLNNFAIDQLNLLSATNTLVTMRNPHRANTPNPTGEGERGSRGEFTMTLDQFLLNFDRLGIGKVRDDSRL